MMRHRHRCPFCLKVVCGDCLRETSELPGGSPGQPQRVCSICVDLKAFAAELRSHQHFAVRGGPSPSMRAACGFSASRVQYRQQRARGKPWVVSRWLQGLPHCSVHVNWATKTWLPCFWIRVLASTRPGYVRDSLAVHRCRRFRSP